jgi:N-acetylmuramoyl-L-alanine amidase-like protein
MSVATARPVSVTRGRLPAAAAGDGPVLVVTAANARRSAGKAERFTTDDPTALARSEILRRRARRPSWHAERIRALLTTAAVAGVLAAPARAAGGFEAECPQRLACRVAPAAYAQNSPGNPADYGNYDLAGRPADGLAIRYVVIHDTEYEHDATVALFQDSRSRVSAHYVIRSADGHVTQMVPTAHVAWHAGNWWINSHAIGIEIEGFALEGATWYTTPVYRSLGRLLRYLTNRFDIPLDRAHVIGHDEVPGPTASHEATMHWDPGPFFDWERLMRLAGAPIAAPGGERRGRVVTIAARFADNRPVVTSCDTTPCRTLPSQPANFVELHTGPSAASPLEPAGEGTTRADDWGSKARTGQRFAVAGHDGEWTAIWHGGRKAWFHDPGGAVGARSAGTLVTPRAGLASIPVYGRAYPGAVSSETLGHAIPAGQRYVAHGLVGADYYAATVFNAPDTYSVISAEERFYAISFNHRQAFVRASDVEILDDEAD